MRISTNMAGSSVSWGFIQISCIFRHENIGMYGRGKEIPETIHLFPGLIQLNRIKYLYALKAVSMIDRMLPALWLWHPIFQVMH
ncbi:MAG: hypothetical protein V1775_02100 [Bacteroidota bacterium]